MSISIYCSRTQNPITPSTLISSVILAYNVTELMCPTITGIAKAACVIQAICVPSSNVGRKSAVVSSAAASRTRAWPISKYHAQVYRFASVVGSCYQQII